MNEVGGIWGLGGDGGGEERWRLIEHDGVFMGNLLKKGFGLVKGMM